MTTDPKDIIRRLVAAVSFETEHLAAIGFDDDDDDVRKYRALIAEAEAYLASVERVEPVAWIRRHPDGSLTGELLRTVEPVRATSGAWLPLCTHPAPQESGGWQPIATAPNDGSPFLVLLTEPHLGSRIHAATFHPLLRIIGGAFAFDVPAPTHWMPLPAPPTDTKEE